MNVGSGQCHDAMPPSTTAISRLPWMVPGKQCFTTVMTFSAEKWSRETLNAHAKRFLPSARRSKRRLVRLQALV